MRGNKTLVKNEKTTAQKTVVNDNKTKNKKNSKIQPVETPGEYFNTSELAAKYNLDRATVRKRLQLVGIEPDIEKAKEKLYLMSDELEDALVDEGSPELDAARLRKLTVEAELKELDLKVRSGEYSSVAELTETVQKLFGALHRKCVIAQPRVLARKLLHVRGDGQIAQIIADEYDKIFQELRVNPKKFLPK